MPLLHRGFVGAASPPNARADQKLHEELQDAQDQGTEATRANVAKGQKLKQMYQERFEQEKGN